MATLVGLGLPRLGLLGLGLPGLGLLGLAAAILGGHLCVKINAAAMHSMNGMGAQLGEAAALLILLERFCCLAKNLFGVHSFVCRSKCSHMLNPFTFCHLDCVGYVLGYV